MDQREAAARNGRWEGRRGGHGITPQASGDEGNTQTFTEDHWSEYHTAIDVSGSA